MNMGPTRKIPGKIDTTRMFSEMIMLFLCRLIVCSFVPLIDVGKETGESFGSQE